MICNVTRVAVTIKDKKLKFKLELIVMSIAYIYTDFYNEINRLQLN